LGKRPFASSFRLSAKERWKYSRGPLSRRAPIWRRNRRRAIKKADLPSGSPLESAYDRMRTAREQEARSIRAEGQKRAQIIRAEADAEAAQIYAGGLWQGPGILRFLPGHAVLSDHVPAGRQGKAGKPT
jgi:membrane protease subunit HflC